MSYGGDPQRGVIKCDQPTSNAFGRLTDRVVEDLRIHVQGRIDLGVAHELCNHFSGHPKVVRPRRVGAPEREPSRMREPQFCTGWKNRRTPKNWTARSARNTLFSILLSVSNRATQLRARPKLLAAKRAALGPSSV